MIKSKFLYIMYFFIIILTGCWDVINIEERGFIVGAAIDIEDVEEEIPEYLITNQMVLPAGIGGPSKGGNGDDKAFLNITSTGNSIYKVDQEMAAMSSKVPYYEHLTTLIISDDVARKKHLLSNLLDTYIRDVDLRRGVKVIVSEGEASKALNFETPEEQLPAMHMEKLLEESSKQVGILKPKSVGDVEDAHLRNSSFILPYLQMNEYMEYRAGVVFHGSKDKMVGVFHEEEMQGIEIVKNEHQTKIIDFIYNDETFALKAIRSKSNVTVDPKNIDEVQVTIDITLEGIIKEMFSNTDLSNSAELMAVRKAVSDKVEELVEKAIIKGRDELGTDVFGIWQELETKHYDKWKQVKNDWEKGEYYFKNVDFNVNVTTEIYSIGTTNKTK